MGHAKVEKFVPTDEMEFIPSHKQHSLFSNLTPEDITRVLGVEPKLGSRDGKCDHTWSFVVTIDGVPPIYCEIWDFMGSRWSAYGPRVIFEKAGFLSAAPVEED